MNFGLSLKIALPMLAITVWGIAFNGYLNYAKFEKHLTQVEMSRMRYAVDDIRGNLETGLRLGLPVKAISNAQEIMAFAMRKDASIISLDVLDHEGKVIFSSGQKEPFRYAPGNWRILLMSRHKSVELMVADAFLLITPLVGITADFSGALMVRYARDTHDLTMREVAGALVPTNLMAILLSILVGALGIYLLIRAALGRIRSAEQALSAGSSGAEAPSHDVRSAGDVDSIQSTVNVAHLAIREIQALGETLARGAPR